MRIEILSTYVTKFTLMLNIAIYPHAKLNFVPEASEKDRRRHCCTPSDMSSEMNSGDEFAGGT